MSIETKKGAVPRLRFPEFEGAGEWKETAIGEIAQVTTGGTPESTNTKYWNGDIPWMNSGELNHKRVHSVANGITPLGLKESSTRVIPPRCVLIGLAGQGKTRGTAAINYIELCTNQSIAAIHPNSELFDSEFLYQRMDAMYDELRALSTGEGGRGGLNLQIIKSVQLFLPTIPEQQKIAATLSSLDDLIAAEVERGEALKAHKRGLMQALFPAEGESVPRVRFEGFEDVGEWEIKPLREVAKNLDYQRVPITENVRTKGHVPYYGASGVIDYVQDYLFDEDLLCISEDGANLVARTYPIAFSITGKTWVNNHAHVLRFEKCFTQVIVENYLNAINLESFLTGMAQPKLNRAKLDIIPIPLPETEGEQQKIANILSSLDDFITAQTQKIDVLKTHKRGLMLQLFPATSTA